MNARGWLAVRWFGGWMLSINLHTRTTKLIHKGCCINRTAARQVTEPRNLTISYMQS
jgi:hypothetical protein